MQLLIDTDIFCKLGVAGLLDEALAVLGTSREGCARLAALSYMLRRGRLVRLYGQERCAALASVAEAMPVAAIPGAGAMDLFVQIPAIDAGEAQLLALVAEHGLVLLSGDKRALREVRAAEALLPALAGRIVVFEAVLIALCTSLGVEEVRAAVESLHDDQMIKVCFSSTNTDPVAALTSYLGALERDAAPLVLWKPFKDNRP